MRSAEHRPTGRLLARAIPILAWRCGAGSMRGSQWTSEQWRRLTRLKATLTTIPISTLLEPEHRPPFSPQRPLTPASIVSRKLLESTEQASVMAKTKSTGVGNRHHYARVSFLYQAAALLATSTAAEAGQDMSAGKTTAPKDVEDGVGGVGGVGGVEGPQLQGMSRRLATDMRTVSLKTQMRMTPDMKRTLCKYCDTLLIEGKTCISTVENESKGGRKRWADVLVIKCKTCGGAKRFPVDAGRQLRKPFRPKIIATEDIKEK